jgi:hypothetical protein
MGAVADTTKGGNWLRCFNAAMGFTTDLPIWTDKSHGRAYAKAEEVRASLEASYPLLKAFADPGYGVSCEKTAQLVSVLVTEVPSIRSSFWSCMGVTETEAAEQLRARAGVYYDSLMSALAMLYNAEASERMRGMPSDGAAAGVILVLGTTVTLFSVFMKKRSR